MKVRLGVVLSSALLVWFTFATVAAAHEVFPSIGDMEQSGDTLTFSIVANAESFVAGIDLTEVTNTNDAAEAETYTGLRALPPETFEARFEAFWPQMAERITIRAGETGLAPRFVSVSVTPEGNLELPRSTTFVFTVELPDGAETVTFGWDRAFGALVLRQQGVEAPFDGYIEAGGTTDPITLAGGDQATGWETFFGYVPVGFDHIVPKGLDHILFVLGLFFLSTRFGPLLTQVTLFTLAHTITLALAALGYVSIPGAIVEPLIAASIVFVAVENVVARGVSRWRSFVVFGFGLLHGLGFASVLAEFGLPDYAFVPALIGFNLGVEFGQLFIILMAFLLVIAAIRIDRGNPESRITTAFYVVLTLGFAGLAAAVWTAPGQFGRFAMLSGEVPLWLFLGPATALSLLCLMSVRMSDRVDAYRRIVSIPASLAIAVVGVWWFVERVFL